MMGALLPEFHQSEAYRLQSQKNLTAFVVALVAGFASLPVLWASYSHPAQAAWKIAVGASVILLIAGIGSFIPLRNRLFSAWCDMALRVEDDCLVALSRKKARRIPWERIAKVTLTETPAGTIVSLVLSLHPSHTGFPEFLCGDFYPPFLCLTGFQDMDRIAAAIRGKLPESARFRIRRLKYSWDSPLANVISGFLGGSMFLIFTVGIVVGLYLIWTAEPSWLETKGGRSFTALWNIVLCFGSGIWILMGGKPFSQLIPGAKRIERIIGWLCIGGGVIYTLHLLEPVFSH